MSGEELAKTRCKDGHMLDLDVIVSCDSLRLCDWTGNTDGHTDKQIMVGRDKTIISDQLNLEAYK